MKHCKLSTSLKRIHELDVLHLRIFGCAVYVPIEPPLHTKKGLKKMGIYVIYDLPSIIHHLEPLTDGFFTIYFTNYHFDEIVFLSMRGDKNVTNCHG